VRVFLKVGRGKGFEMTNWLRETSQATNSSITSQLHDDAPKVTDVHSQFGHYLIIAANITFKVEFKFSMAYMPCSFISLSM
jgi:hypothetical protein